MATALPKVNQKRSLSSQLTIRCRKDFSAVEINLGEKQGNPRKIKFWLVFKEHSSLIYCLKQGFTSDGF